MATLRIQPLPKRRRPPRRPPRRHAGRTARAVQLPCCIACCPRSAATMSATEPETSLEAIITATAEDALPAAPEKAGTSAPGAFYHSPVRARSCSCAIGVRFRGRCGAKLEEVPPPEELRCSQRQGARWLWRACGICAGALHSMPDPQPIRRIAPRERFRGDRMTAQLPRFCEQCGASLAEGVRFVRMRARPCRPCLRRKNSRPSAPVKEPQPQASDAPTASPGP